MASFKSKHQNQYQWQEVQDLIQNFAKQVREKNEREQKTLTQRPLIHQDIPHQDIPVSPSSPTQNTPQSIPQEPTLSIPTKPHSELKIDLQRFREAWERQQVKQHEPQTLQSKDSVSPQSNSLTQWDFENNHPLPKAETNAISPKDQVVSPSSQPKKQGVQAGNPWEMLRDHFIALRERRIALEKQKDSEPKT